VAKNYYFENFENSMEQSLIEDLVIESIKVYGMDVWYIPRTIVGKDDILNEDDISTFDEAYMAEMYVKSVDGFEGEGDFLSKFGLEIRDSITMTVARRTYEEEVGTYRVSNTRPMEGDLIYLPLNNKIFEIQHVEHESIFYQMGSLQMYDLRAELFEFSGERFRTGQKFIDTKFDGINTFVSLEAGSNTFNIKVDNEAQYFVQDPDASDSSRFYSNQTIELRKGTTYTFNLSDSSNAGSAFSVYDQDTSTQSTGVTSSGTPGTTNAKVTFVPSATGVYNFKALNGATQRNVLQYSEGLDSTIASNETSWITSPAQTDSTNKPVITTISDTPIGNAPSGRTATKIVFPQATTGHIGQSASISSNSNAFIGSVWVRNASPGLKLRVNTSPTDGLYGSEIDIPQSTSWQRITTGRGGFPSNLSNCSLYIRNVTGNANASVEFWGVQLEQSSGSTANTVGETLPTVYQSIPGNTYSANNTSIIGNNASVLEEAIDALADNTAIESFITKDTTDLSDNIIDFTESNPFGDNEF